eukprot:GHUV01006852.1.p1 GENE.GHUV01006852.1~~GHUV01006852.1.p1  ORF type:complete len:812 (+),score=281.02 GHUV01006852.1:993-3428(+)
MDWRQKREQHCALAWLTALLLALLQHVNAAAALQDMVVPLPAGYYNPSLVVYKGSGWLVSRSTSLKWDTMGLKWILNRAYLCQVNVTDWSPMGCHAFDPWRGEYGTQCRWGSEKWKVPWEASGVDDTKLFKWPSRGLWAITGRRPQKPVDSIYCRQPVVWQQWLVQLAPEGQQVDPNLFDLPQEGPVGVTWGKKPDSQAPAAASAPQAVAAPPAAGKRKMQRWFPLSPAAFVSAPEDDSSATSGDVSQAARSLPPNIRLRRHRRRHRRSAAGTVIGGYNVVGEDSLIPESRAPAHHHKEHRRPGMHAAAALPAQQQKHELDAAAPQAPPLQPTKLQPGIPAVAAAGGPVAPLDQARKQTLATAIQQQQHMGTAATAEETNIPDQAGARSTAGSNSAGGGTESEPTQVSTPATWEAYWGHAPVGLAISDAKAVYGREHSINEKNWMPFVWEGKLFVTYRLVPTHKVYELHPNGTAEPAHETDSGATFSGLGTATSRLHGGPPLIYIDYPKYLTTIQDPGIQAATINQQPYYLGVAHYWLPVGKGDGRTYHHYLIRVEGRPPFRVLQVSAELPVQYNKRYKRVAFVSGIDIALLQAGAAAAADADAPSSGKRDLLTPEWLGQSPARVVLQQPQQQLLPHILVSYGSGDWESHVAVMTLDEAEQLFMQGPADVGEAAGSSSVTDVATTGASFAVAGGRGQYTLLRRKAAAEESSSGQQQRWYAAVRSSSSSNSADGDAGEEEQHGGLDHGFLHHLSTEVEAEGAKSTFLSSLKAAAAEVAAAEASIPPFNDAPAAASNSAIGAGDAHYDFYSDE